MFYHLEGTVSFINPEMTVINCNGIGLKVLTTPNTISTLKINDSAKLYISESVGEDHFDLYGFTTIEEKKYFELLTSVSGIGPKAALSILSYNTTESITNAIINNNEAAFTSCPGIGKKTAQRVILELKDKIAKGLEFNLNSFAVQNNNTSKEIDNAYKALISLGYNSNEISAIIKQIDTNDMSSDQIVKSVLRYML